MHQPQGFFGQGFIMDSKIKQNKRGKELRFECNFDKPKLC